MISHFNSMAVVQLSKHSHKCCFDVCQYQKCVENVWGKSNSISHKSNRKHFDTPSMNNIKPMRTTDSWNINIKTLWTIWCMVDNIETSETSLAIL